MQQYKLEVQQFFMLIMHHIFFRRRSSSGDQVLSKAIPEAWLVRDQEVQLGQGLGAVKGGVVQKGISFNAAQWLPVSITLCCAFTHLMCFIAFHFYSFNLVLHSLIYVLSFFPHSLFVLNYSFLPHSLFMFHYFVS